MRISKIQNYTINNSNINVKKNNLSTFSMINIPNEDRFDSKRISFKSKNYSSDWDWALIDSARKVLNGKKSIIVGSHRLAAPFSKESRDFLADFEDLKNILREEDNPRQPLFDYLRPNPQQGFASIAGREGYKNVFKNDIIGPLDQLINGTTLVRPSNMLLCGPPGCGKTYMAKAFLSELEKKGVKIYEFPADKSDTNKNINFIKTVYNETYDGWMQARKTSALFIDEIEQVIPSLDINPKRSQEVHTLLNFEKNLGAPVFILGATNNFGMINKGFLTNYYKEKDFLIFFKQQVDYAAPFRYCYDVVAPDKSDINNLLRYQIKNVKGIPDYRAKINYDKVAESLDQSKNQYSASDLVDLVNHVFNKKKFQPIITTDDFIEGINAVKGTLRRLK